MIYAVLRGDADVPVLQLLYITLLFLVCGVLILWLHNAVEKLITSKTVAGAFSGSLKEPNDVLSLVCFVFFGVGWFKTVPCDTEKRGKRFLVGISGPALCFIVSMISVVMIRIARPVTALYLFFKVLFRVSAYGAIFSLLPLAPYDGGQILLSVLPSKWHTRFLKSKDFSLVVMIAAVLALIALGKIPVMSF